MCIGVRNGSNLVRAGERGYVSTLEGDKTSGDGDLQLIPVSMVMLLLHPRDMVIFCAGPGIETDCSPCSPPWRI